MSGHESGGGHGHESAPSASRKGGAGGGILNKVVEEILVKGMVDLPLNGIVDVGEKLSILDTKEHK